MNKMQKFEITLPDELANDIKDEIVRSVNEKVNSLFSFAKEEIKKSEQFPPYLNLKQAAQLLGVTYPVLKKIIADYDDFPVFHLGGIYRVNREALVKFTISHYQSFQDKGEIL